MPQIQRTKIIQGNRRLQERANAEYLDQGRRHSRALGTKIAKIRALGERKNRYQGRSLFHPEAKLDTRQVRDLRNASDKSMAMRRDAAMANPYALAMWKSGYSPYARLGRNGDHPTPAPARARLKSTAELRREGLL